MNSNPQNTPPLGDRQGPPRYPVILQPEGLVKAWMEAHQAGGFLGPTRKIPPKRGSLAGYVPFPGLLRNVWHESGLERDLLLILRLFDGLIGVLEQPIRLDCPTLGYGRGAYSPDFLVWVRIKTAPVVRPVLVEVKYEEELREKWTIIRPKVMAARRFAARQGWRFLIITPRHLRVPLPLPPVLSGKTHRPYELADPTKVLARLFGSWILRGQK